MKYSDGSEDSVNNPNCNIGEEAEKRRMLHLGSR